jgi:serine/threonine protein kinase
VNVDVLLSILVNLDVLLLNLFRNSVSLQSSVSLSKMISLFLLDENAFVSDNNPRTCAGAVIDTQDPLMVMEFMHHGSLYDILHNETMVLEGSMRLQLLQDISQGMRFLHANEPPIVHCDLKAANVLVDSRWRAKIADLGFASDASKAAGRL